MTSSTSRDILEVQTPRWLVQTFHVAIEEPAASDPPSRVIWRTDPVGDRLTRVRLIHEDMSQATRDYVAGGWEHLLSGLKALVRSRRQSARFSAENATNSDATGDS